MKDISTSIKKVLFIYLLLFIALISYISYFEIFVSQTVVNNPNNKRLWAKRNEVLRGTIYDRNMKPLTKSQRVNTLTQKREYTGGDLFAHALGYVDVKYGITGLERKYDADLMGAKNQSFGDFIKSKGKSEEKVGNSIVTTLDYNLQKVSSDMLGDDIGAVVAINPRTGEILAMVSKPTFNPNNLEATWKDLNSNKNLPLLNRALIGLYPPGSIFKTITAASALENISDVNSRTFHDKGKLVFNSKYSLSNFNGEVLGDISFKDAYVHSSNVVFGSLGLELGNDKLKKTAEKFYFNKDVKAEGISIANSRFSEFKPNEKGNIAQSAIGQSSVLVSPMEMALVAGTIANGGMMMRPTLVKQVLDSQGNSLKMIDKESLGQIIATENAKIIKDFMKDVVKSGTGRNAAIDGVTVCGKTGTADHKDSQKGENKPHSWFIGFAPYENPQIAVAVIVENGGQGGRKAAAISREVIKTYLKK